MMGFLPYLACAVLAIAAYLLLTRRRRPRQMPQCKTIEDSVLGEVMLVSTGDSDDGTHYQVNVTTTIDGEECELSTSYIGDNEEQLEAALNQLRTFFGFATDEQQRKVYRNSLLQLREMQATLNPDSAITDTKLTRTSKLVHVNVLDGSAWFVYHSPLAQNNMCVTVDDSGQVTFVGVG